MNKETEHTDPVLFSSDHRPEAIPQTSRVPHGTRRSVPRLIDGIHIPDSDVDEVIECGIVERHIIRPAIQLVLMEGYQAPMIDEVVQQQPLLQDVPKILLDILRPKEGGIDDL